MSLKEQVVADRSIGQLPLSIATSLALEGAFGIYPDRPEKKAPIQNYTHLWVNVYTLFRNLFNALPTQHQEGLLQDTLSEALAEEIITLEAVVKDQVGMGFKVIYYIPDLTQLERHFPKAILKQPTTPKQKIFKVLMMESVEMAAKIVADHDVRRTPIKLKGEGRSLMLTHAPVDLLSYNSFDDLALLESHTGVVKRRNMWGTKLSVKDETIPFNVFTLQIFGDGPVHFTPLSLKYRRTMLELAKKERWSPVTTVNRMKMALASIRDKEIRDDLMAILRSTSF